MADLSDLLRKRKAETQKPSPYQQERERAAQIRRNITLSESEKEDYYRRWARRLAQERFVINDGSTTYYGLIDKFYVKCLPGTIKVFYDDHLLGTQPINLGLHRTLYDMSLQVRSGIEGQILNRVTMELRWPVIEALGSMLACEVNLGKSSIDPNLVEGYFYRTTGRLSKDPDQAGAYPYEGTRPNAFS